MNRKTIRAALAGLALAVGLTACGHAGTTVAEPGQVGVSATSQTTAEHTGPLVDVSSIWADNPLPNCPKLRHANPIAAPPGLEVPDHQTVGEQIAGVKSPASEAWVRSKLSWLNVWLDRTIADLVHHASDSGRGNASVRKSFDRYTQHVRQELVEGRDIPDATLDNIFPQKCE